VTPTLTRRRNRRTTILITILTTCVVALGAMGAAWAFGWNLVEPKTAPTPTPSRAQGVPYKTALDLAVAVDAAGTTCTGFRPVTQPTAGRDSGDCATDGGDLFISIYADPERRKAEAEAVMASSPRRRHMLLVGPNWTIYGPDAVIDVLVKKIGGFLIVPPR
jgi:hypothetical protein